jgi:DnaJ-domain-containing protein 1
MASYDAASTVHQSLVAASTQTKRTLTAAYRKAMMKFHLDRTRSACVEQQALAAEVTKWITHAWQTIRD